MRTVILMVLAACGSEPRSRGADVPDRRASPGAPGVEAPETRDALVPLGSMRPTRSEGPRAIHIMDFVWVGDTALLATFAGAIAVDVSVASAPVQLGGPMGARLYWLAEGVDALFTSGRGDGVRRLTVEGSGDWLQDARASSGDFTPEGLAVGGEAGERLLVAAQEDGLVVYDADGLQRLGAWEGAHNAIDVVVMPDAPDIAWVGDRGFGLRAVDLSDLAAPSPTLVVPIPGAAVQHLAASPEGGHLYVAAGASLVTVDAVVGEVVDERRPGGVATRVDVHGDLLALANWSDTRLYDISDRGRPRLIAVEDSTDASMSVAFAPGGGLLGVGDWDHLRLYRVDATAREPEIDAPGRLTVFGDSGETEVIVVVRNDGPVTLEVFDVTCERPDALWPMDRQATVASGGAVPLSLKVDLDAAGAGAPWLGRCDVWSTDPDEPLLAVEIEANPAGLSVGDPAPDWTLPDLEGTLHTLSDQRGKVVVMSIFSSL